MPEDLQIKSFDELKAELDKALHEGGIPSETADYLMQRFDVLCVDIDSVFLAVSAEDVKECYPNLSIDEACEARDNAAENLWNSGGYDHINDTAWDQIKAEVKRIRPPRGNITHAENSLDELADTYGEKDAGCEDHDFGDAEDIPR